MSSGSPLGLEIAIVGWAGRFPGASSVDQLWRNLRDGVESIRDLSPEELAASGASGWDDPRYVRRAADLEGVELFDAPLFGFTRREAELADPQLRALLEDARSALEDAGHLSDRHELRVGVFAGASESSYLTRSSGESDAGAGSWGRSATRVTTSPRSSPIDSTFAGRA